MSAQVTNPEQRPDTRTAAVIEAWASSVRRGVIFDFNGTLSDDEPLLLRIYTDMFLEHLQWTLTPRHYYARLAGCSDREIIDIVVEEFGDGDQALASRLLHERQQRYCRLVEQRSPIAPGTVELVQLLHDQHVPIGIVTGAPRTEVDFVLACSAITDLFTVTITDEDVANGKPDPEGYLAGAHKLAVDPAHLLAFEDSVPGVRAARAAGMRCLAVEGTRPRAVLESEADAVVARLEPSLFVGLPPVRARITEPQNTPSRPARRSAEARRPLT